MNSLISQAKILVIDDEMMNLIVMDGYLSSVCKEVIVQTDIDLGLALAKQKQPDIILLDVLMGNMTGYEVCQRLKATTETSHIPVIFLSSLVNPEDKVKGFEVGGVDFISKPFAIAEVIARIESCLKLHQKLRKMETFINEIEIKESAEVKKAKMIANYGLKENDVKVLDLYVQGHSYQDIAAQIKRSEHTVRWYLKKLFLIFEVDSRAALIKKVRSFGL